VPLPPGTRLGPFEVIAQIGVGGMGEVYRATDTNLKRPVAIKVLPEAVAADADRLARFQREAEVLAAPETRLTTDPAPDRSPTWTPDSKRVIYTSDRKGSPNLFWQSADAVTEAEQLTKGAESHFLHSISPDGKRIVLRENRDGQTSRADLMMLLLDGSTLEKLIVSPSSEFNGEISPDGRWLAYQTDRSGRFDIVVSSFPDVRGGVWPISTEGGTEPLWSRNTPELFYRAPNGAV
jgi:dipeptidyl aminopeptidase/acylaminoacyl peptidase